MAKMNGRAVIVSLDSTPIAAARTKSLTINNSVIDVTTDDDAGIRTLLAEPGEKAIDISIDGLLEDDVLLNLSLAADTTGTFEFNYGSGNYKLTGTFNMTSYSEGLSYNDAVTFSASFSSSGAITKAAVV